MIGLQMTNKIYKVKNYQTASMFFQNNKPLPNECKYYDGVPLRKDRVDSYLALRYDEEDDVYAVVLNGEAVVGYYGPKDYYKIVVPKRCKTDGTPEQIALFLPDGIHARYIDGVASLFDKVPSKVRQRVFPYENQTRTIVFQDDKWHIGQLRPEVMVRMDAKQVGADNTEFLIKKILGKKPTPAQERTKSRLAVYETLVKEASIALRLIKLNKKLKRSEREHIDRVLLKSMSGYKEPVKPEPNPEPVQEHSEPVLPPPPLPKASTTRLNKIYILKQNYGGKPIDISTHDKRKEALQALAKHKREDPEAKYFLIKK